MTSDIMKEALALSEDAGSNSVKLKQPWKRPSAIGKPTIDLVLLVLQDVLKDLEDTPKNVSKLQQARNKHIRQFKAQLGFLWESVSRRMLVELYPSYDVRSSEKLHYENIKGTLDLLLVDDLNKHVIVCDCKALGVSTKADGVNSLSYSGYPHQLAIYTAAVMKDFPGYTIDGMWHLLCTLSHKEYRIDVLEAIDVFRNDVERDNWVMLMLEEVEKNANFMSNFDSLFEAKDVPSIVSAALIAAETAPLKTPTRYGYLKACCNFHFSPLYQLTKDGEEGNIDEEQFKELLTEQLTNYFAN